MERCFERIIHKTSGIRSSDYNSAKILAVIKYVLLHLVG